LLHKNISSLRVTTNNHGGGGGGGGDAFLYYALGVVLLRISACFEVFGSQDP
jgi:hypothetical protein